MAQYWSTTLPDDLIREIGQCFLATNDLDFYVDFRAACRDWHRASPDPKEDAMDPKFLPSKWIMAKHSVLEDGKVTFVNLSTGRSICKSISHVLRRYSLVGVTTRCLFVLVEREEPHKIQVLNPFMGTMVHFKAGVPWDQLDAVAVTLSPMRVFATSLPSHRVRWIDEDSEKSTPGWSFQDGWGFQDKSFGRSPWYGCLVGMTPFAGGVYTTDNSNGSIISVTDAAAAEKDQRQQLPAILGAESYAQVLGGNYFYLVESQEELLFVIDRRLPYYKGGPLVYKVDAVNKVLVPVRSIGSHALFVGQFWCLSVDASKLHTVESGIYYADYSTIIDYDYESLPDGGWVEAEPAYVVEFERNRGGYCRPFSLAQILVHYCRSGQ